MRHADLTSERDQAGTDRFRVALMSGRELFVALAGAKLTSNHDEHHSRYREFARSLLHAKSPLAAL